MDKYEISIWEDYSDQTSDGKQFLNERKIAVIGSDTMTAQARALEPNLIEEINGTHTFTFKMYYTYTDNETGEKYKNPFGKYLINERKVKVFWKNQWYDLVIKKCQEDTAKKSITYTCTDLFINELSKQGYSLEFDTELQNNIGTAEELATSVLEGSTWMYDKEKSIPIIQRTEGPVYEVITHKTVHALKQSPGNDTFVNIPANAKVLIFYDSIVGVIKNGGTNVPTQFLYAAGGYETDINDSLVINGDCYQVNINWTRNKNYLIGTSDLGTVFEIDSQAGISEKYRAARLVRSQRTEYDPLLERYVLLCKESTTGKEVYEIATTEYTNPLAIINLVANPSEFTNVQGWIGQVGEFGVYPKFGTSTDISTYTAKSYLKILNGSTYNTGIQSNISQFKPTNIEVQKGDIGGIQEGEKYIFRVKAKIDSSNAPSSTYITSTEAIRGNLYKYNNSYELVGEPLFTQIGTEIIDNWVEFTLQCNTAISATDIDKYGLFVISNGTYWIEDIQFFKYSEGVPSYDTGAQPQRMNPGEISLQSIAQPIYKYYYKDNNAKTADELTFIYTCNIEESSIYQPIYNNYEKIGTISERESNRFNILQSIAETFQAWVKFRIDHEENGAIKIIDGIPQKFVYFVEEIGEDTGISFEYGIDLKTISRTIDSDKLATKVIVNPNSNEFAPNGFCSIARSNWNYSKENFILNLDYYTQQNLLDKETLNKDLYGTQDGYIGYYYYLHAYNKEYDDITEELMVKNLDLTRQKAQQEVYKQYLLSARQQLEVIESDLMSLAGTSQWADAQTYARSHASNDKVQTLLNAHSQVQNEIERNEQSLNDINTSIAILEDYITSAQTQQEELLTLINEKHQEFNNKYSTYIMEGTWQDEDYIDADKYYLDGINVAYTSSRPQLSYTINVLRLSSLEEFSSKIFHLGDICYMQDREFFGYLADKITPYKERILVSKISSFFDQPEKDVLTIQNYKTRFDDLFQRIAATTQSLAYAEGSFARAAGVINHDKTFNFTALQDTFDANSDFVLNSSNQDVIWDDTGITVTNKFNSADKTKILAGGIFVTNDGGQTWKNAIRGDGISTELLTAGRINTSEIYIFDGKAPSFRWDSDGLTAYSYNSNGINFGKFVRHDKYGIYGYDGLNDFIPNSEQEIWDNSKFGLTWKGFFLKSGSTNASFEISTDKDLVIKAGDIKRVQIGRLNDSTTNYGLQLRDSGNNVVFTVDSNGANIAGWTMNNNSIYKTIDNNTIGLFSNGKQATIQGNTADYYIIAGNKFGVTIDGKIYAEEGYIGGWEITSSSLRSYVNSDNFIVIHSATDGAYIEGQSGADNYWWVGKGSRGLFKFVDNSGGSEIKLGDTSITKDQLLTKNINVGGGSIGGCYIGGSSISGNGWSLSSTGITIGGVTLPSSGMHWATIKYVSDLSNLKLSYTQAGVYLLPTAINEEGRVTSYSSSVAVCHGWSQSASYYTNTVNVLRGDISSETSGINT